MTRSLKAKLILSYLAVALLTVLAVSIVIRLTSGRSLMNLVVDEQTASLQTALKEYHTLYGTLDGFFDQYIQSSRRDMPPPEPGDSPGPGDFQPQSHEVRGLYGVVDDQYRAVLPTLGRDVGEAVPQGEIRQKVAVQVDGQTIAYILPDTSYQFKLSAEEQVFLRRTTLAIGLAALGGVGLAVGMGFLLAGRLLLPIRRLTRASQALAAGDLEQQVPVTSRDELGLLTTTFNQMSAGLAQADQQRRRMTADITHDLSTPLQILSGYMEMLEEGEVTLTPQRLEIIKTEIEHLRRLVGDLSTLTQVEAGALEIQLAPLPAAALLERVYHAFQPIAARQGVELCLEPPAAGPNILVDEGRMVQVLKNLLENALRYTPQGGRVTLSAQANGEVSLCVRDTGDGIDPDDLPYVFDRFYRADKSRGGSPGKMGLGLAICKALVTAQGGTIRAESDGKGRGAAIIITIPRAS